MSFNVDNDYIHSPCMLIDRRVYLKSFTKRMHGFLCCNHMLQLLWSIDQPLFLKEARLCHYY